MTASAAGGGSPGTPLSVAAAVTVAASSAPAARRDSWAAAACQPLLAALLAAVAAGGRCSACPLQATSRALGRLEGLQLVGWAAQQAVRALIPVVSGTGREGGGAAGPGALCSSNLRIQERNPRRRWRFGEHRECLAGASWRVAGNLDAACLQVAAEKQSAFLVLSTVR